MDEPVRIIGFDKEFPTGSSADITVYLNKEVNSSDIVNHLKAAWSSEEYVVSMNPSIMLPQLRLSSGDTMYYITINGTSLYLEHVESTPGFNSITWE